MATGVDSGGAGLFSGLAGAARGGFMGTSSGVDTATTQIEAQAGGYATSAAQGVRDVFAGAVDELHTQEEQAATWLRWGTVAFALLVLLLVVVIGAWFFAPARTVLGALT